MPNQSKKWADFAWMSQASYLELSGFSAATPLEVFRPGLENSALNSDKSFAPSQALAFTETTTGYSFVDQQPNQASGFSATLFKTNAASNEYEFAVRGTEISDVGDLIADALGIGLTGKARVQTLDAYRYYKRLSSNAGMVSYTDGEIEKLVALSAFKYEGHSITELRAMADFRADARALSTVLAGDTGLALIPAGSTVNFTGHSLGGHVAVLLAELVGEASGADAVGEVFTYNAPGQFALAYEIQN